MITLTRKNGSRLLVNIDHIQSVDDSLKAIVWIKDADLGVEVTQSFDEVGALISRARYARLTNPEVTYE